MGVIVMKDWIIEKYYKTNREELVDKHLDIEVLEAELRQEDIEEIYKEYYS
ncbi:TPA: hypothetical protein I9063_002421 [Clostridium perfringens]|uniref:Uncharacterized protein n=1 Tax=Clostridium perfringens TaxID=1502 RepID=A0AAN5NBS3_CLOPF|nr:hypothetical protein [Clostridium perfringens]MDM0535498.1 hypothetical protein [Clostridium perfringens]HAT4267784.1 hypothetical protein [Clostridium perfringens]HAT4299036.1 hypothetical protein [Clostridium perfringens]